MPWGIFITDDNDERHVLPVCPEGFATNDHVPARWCWCRPQRDALKPNVVIHDDLEA